MSKNNKGGLDQYGAERFGRFILPQSEKSVGLKGLMLFWYCNSRLRITLLDPQLCASGG